MCSSPNRVNLGYKLRVKSWSEVNVRNSLFIVNESREPWDASLHLNFILTEPEEKKVANLCRLRSVYDSSS